MILIDALIEKTPLGFTAKCNNCGETKSYKNRASALKMLEKNSCFNCQERRHVFSENGVKIYRNSEKKWCSSCPECGVEQAYTRMDHAKTSEKNGWKCKSCVAKAKGFTARSTGFYGNIRLGWFRRFEVSAADRNLYWSLTIEDLDALWRKQNGKCALSGVALDNGYATETVSIDRIDSKKGYVIDNVQLVHKDLNLMKRAMDNDLFISWCRLIAQHKGKL